jgi:hypothetical protein
MTGLMKVKYANQPGKLAEWTAATHIERAAKRSKPKTPDSSAKPNEPAERAPAFILIGAVARSAG